MTTEAYTFKPLPRGKFRAREIRQVARGGNLEAGTYWSVWEVPAEGVQEAEERLLSYLQGTFGDRDDLHGATARGTRVGGSEVYSVRLYVPASS